VLPRRLILAALAVAAVLAGAFGSVRRVLNRSRLRARSEIRSPEEHTFFDESGAVRSVQAADITLPPAELERIWSPENLERLARTYWRFLTRATLGLIRVYYTDSERYVCVLIRQLPLLTFQAPEYQMDAERGIVRWRIKSGLLVSREGRGKGYLEIDVQRCPEERPGEARLHVEVEVANFYPAIAAGIGRWFYANTQSRMHVIVTHGFLRSLARLDLAPSKVGRLSEIDDLPDPPAGGQHVETQAA
jgi:hypothetical protein